MKKDKPELTVIELMIATGKGKILTEYFLGNMKCSPESPCPVQEEG